jgi:hypothetical protein
MRASTRSLLTGIIDYAGTFPPASLSLAESMAEYAQVRTSAGRWLVGRLIVPAASLPEFDALASQWPEDQGSRLPDPGATREGWEVSVVLGARPQAQLVSALAFIDRPNTKYRIASLEFPALGPAEIGQSISVPETIDTFFEVPIDADLEPRIQAIAARGAFAKVRTGGIATGTFPSPEGLVRFLEACSSAGVAFKATAGLHHAVRGSYPLTYEGQSQRETMHGFLNVSIAAAIVHMGGESPDAVEALRETSTQRFQFRSEDIAWKGRTIAADDLAASRRLFFRSFGSCSVREPLDELAGLRLL